MNGTQSGASGGGMAREVGARDEEKMATGADPQPTRPTKSSKVQPRAPTRADHEGAAR